MAYADLSGIPSTATVRVRVLLAPDGQVMHTEVAESSGYMKLDSAVVAAIERATPLPALPDPARRRISITFRIGE
jgi:TonB family protein